MHKLVNGVEVEMSHEEIQEHLADQEAITEKRRLKESKRIEDIAKRYQLLSKLAKILECSELDLELLFSNQRCLKFK